MTPVVKICVSIFITIILNLFQDLRILMAMRGGFIYILSNKKRSVLYIGVTADLIYRVAQHKEGEGGFFSNKYKCHALIYYEFYPTIEEAISREKQLKRWHKEWKWNLIKSTNPDLEDLFHKLNFDE